MFEIMHFEYTLGSMGAQHKIIYRLSSNISLSLVCLKCRGYPSSKSFADQITMRSFVRSSDLNF